MYATDQVLRSLDQNMWSVIGLCGFAMVCNYTWFFAAVRQGFKDKVVPIPVFCTLFWLVGDGSMVLQYDQWFHEINHWYVKLFWLALVFTVICELIFLFMTLRFGRPELAPKLNQMQFMFVVFAGLITMAIAWHLIKTRMGDELYIDYFHLANFAGPAFAAAQTIRRGTRAGTTPLIWGAYTLMVGSWFAACALWFGGHFSTMEYITLYAVCTLSSAAMTVYVSRLPAH